MVDSSGLIFWKMGKCQFHEFSGSPIVLQITYEKNMTSRWEVFFLSGKGDMRLIDTLEGAGGAEGELERMSVLD